jgi:hypothetical protein
MLDALASARRGIRRRTARGQDDNNPQAKRASRPRALAFQIQQPPLWQWLPRARLVRGGEAFASEDAAVGAKGIGGDDVRAGVQVVQMNLRRTFTPESVVSALADHNGKPVSTPRRLSSVPVAPSSKRSFEFTIRFHPFGKTIAQKPHNPFR